MKAIRNQVREDKNGGISEHFQRELDICNVNLLFAETVNWAEWKVGKCDKIIYAEDQMNIFIIKLGNIRKVNQVTLTYE